MRTKLIAPIALAALTLATLPAAAQLATGSSSPIDMTADQLEVTNNACTAIWTGNAEALQDTSRLRAQVLRIFNAQGKGGSGGGAGNCGELERLEAEGRADQAEADVKQAGEKVKDAFKH